MKTEIHPEMVECVITCVCGATHKTLAIQPTMRVDICGKCHPFYTVLDGSLWLFLAVQSSAALWSRIKDNCNSIKMKRII